MKSVRPQTFHRNLLRWYARNRRPLPWRETKDPYRILVSEIMLQQTQVDRVWPFYVRFLKRFPTFKKLALARGADVLRAWSGLGYNRRAVHLHRLAQEVVERHGGKVPGTAKELRTLPGIGAYTAQAVATFAFGAPGVFVETNVRRVLGRVFLGKHFPNPSQDQRLMPVAHRAVPKGAAAVWHHAVMDFGALVCKAKPLCAICPVQELCRSYPAILAHPQPKPQRKKESFRGSNRLWRGEIVKALTRAPRHGLSVADLRKQFSKHSNRLPLSRLQNLLRTLEREGMLASVGKRQKRLFALPA